MSSAALIDQTLGLIAQDAYRMRCLRLLSALSLPDGAIAAGFVRNVIWDAIFGVSTPLSDIDVVYFCRETTSVEADTAYERSLFALQPDTWQVRNQARMHLKNDVPPYPSAVDAVRRFPETATCLSVALDQYGQLRMPNHEGLVDAWLGIVRPNPLVPNSFRLSAQRVKEKQWRVIWPGLVLEA